MTKWLLIAALMAAAAVVLARRSGAGAPGPEERYARIRERVTPALEGALRAKGLRLGSPVFMRAFKEERELEVWVEHPGTRRFELFETYPIAAMSGSLGPKLREGDRQAPEGFYFVPPSAMNPASQYHLSFDLGYPNAYDRAHGRTGSFLMVHGDRVSLGCFAMTDPKIEEIYTLATAAFEGGQPFFRVHCFPFRMTAGRMEEARGSRWLSFWNNLKTGYDWFETRRRPPDCVVVEGEYRFGEDG